MTDEVKTEAKKKPNLVEVTLKESHTHQRKQYAAGDKIKVTEATRDRMKKRDKIA